MFRHAGEYHAMALVTGTPCGTLSMTQKASTLRKSLYTRCCQCNGTGAGLLHTLGVADSSMWIFIGGRDIQGNVRWGHVLKVELAYWSISHCRIFALFSGMGSKERDLVISGTVVLCGHSHVIRSSWGCPQPDDNALALVSIHGLFTQLPIAGNCKSMILRSFIVPYDK